jgi:GR25 family glycosyltransferase involved in LPS biosynthesis
MIKNCIIINLDERTDLWNKLQNFRNQWEKYGNKIIKISGVNYKDKPNVVNDFISKNRLNLNGSGFRKTKEGFLGELGCYMGHYNSWKYIVDNNLDNCLILEDGIEFLRNDFENIKINDDLDILFINEEMKVQTNDNKKQFIGYGLQGYIVSQKGAKLLLENCFTLSVPIDLQIRNLCNIHKINGDGIYNYYVKRNNNRLSSIQGTFTNQGENLNDKQDHFTIFQRLIINLIIKNINLDEFI